MNNKLNDKYRREDGGIKTSAHEGVPEAVR